MKRSLGICLGDRYGIGPEIVASVLAQREARNREPQLLILGDGAVLRRGADAAGVTLDVAMVDEPSVPAGSPWALLERKADIPLEPVGRVNAGAGREVLEILSLLTELVGQDAIGGMVYAPLNKAALKIAGHEAGDELAYLVDRLKPQGDYGEINILDDIWTSRLTSHIPLREVADRLSVDAIIDSIAFIDDALRQAGRAEPRIVVTALNPHAGDGGAFGREEIDIIRPAVEKAARMGLNVSGPLPADTVFPVAAREGFDGVVTMFHDQGQIALKLLGLGRGVTLLAGLPVPIATPGHGTAFDIAGQGQAKTEGLEAALDLVATMMNREMTK